ncbi:MAG: 50S ribosomal protein L9 [Alphaproteobacteria bacterium]|jgi:large subunit ribosomal protein L9|nr:50S ribosomal protein L9 [Alphaproteobacteria bacterium]MDP7223330.1 50S ribosomal protein L9 [Alphaproteobacteria bacterium]
MSTQVILLERVDNLGELGDVVSVKPGFARNYLIPQSKALRASQANIAYFEAQKAEIVKKNDAKKKDAEKDAEKLKGLKVAVIRHAAEGGQLYGSVSARDIAETISEKIGLKIGRGMVTLNDAFKTIGLFDVNVALHPEVKVDVVVNVARSEDEAKIQEETGKPLIIVSAAEAEQEEAAAKAEAEAAANAEADAEAAEADKAEEETKEEEKAAE